MNKWSKVLILIWILVLLYSIIQLFMHLPEIPFWKWGTLPCLTTIIVAVLGKEYLDGRKLGRLLYDNKVKYIPYLFAGLERSDYELYQNTLREYYSCLESGISTEKFYIEDEKEEHLENVRKGIPSSFDVRKEFDEKSRLEGIKESFDRVKTKQCTWEDLLKENEKKLGHYYIIKYLLDELTIDEKCSIQTEIERINKIRAGGNKVNLF